MSAETSARLGLVALTCFLVIAIDTSSHAQNPPVQPPIPQAGTRATAYVFGSADCIRCHSQPDPKNDLCRMIEGHFWQKSDPHKIAMDWGTGKDSGKFGGYHSAAGQRAAEIGKRLEIGDVTHATQCIGCHSLSVPAPRSRSFEDPLAEGVTCVACHGTYQEWGLKHQLTGDPTWMKKTRAEKWAEFGMVDLWDPVIRAEVCTSCHVGDPDPQAGKRITHAMYAAGHPPLPSIEVAAFSEEQPKHWLYLRCKSETARKRLEFNTKRMEETEQVAATSLVVLRRMMELVDAETRSQGPQGGWLDFARFDCSACHHELRAEGGRSWRQARAGRNFGRPAAPAWPAVLARLGIDAADPLKYESRVAELDNRLAAFEAALTDKPFGDPDKTGSAAREIINWCKEPLAELSRLATVKEGQKDRVLDKAEAGRLLRRLGEISSADLPDYESARQLGWAFRTIYQELLEVNSALPGGKKALNPFSENQSKVQKILDQLDSTLVLSLRKRGAVAHGACPPAEELMSFPAAPDQKPITGELLEVRLKKLAEYNPEMIQVPFSELMRLLPPH